MSLVLADVQPTENPKITEITVLKDFEGMTNGEVIQTLFSNADYCGGAHFMHITNVNSIGEVSFPWEWWNAPYKAESEVKDGRN